MKAVESDLDLRGHCHNPHQSLRERERERGHPSKESVIHGEPTNPAGGGRQGIQSPRDLYNSPAKPSYPSRPSSIAIPRVELQITNVWPIAGITVLFSNK